MLITAHLVFKIAALFYLLSFGIILANGRHLLFYLFLGTAVSANAAALALRYWLAWPMMPMHLGPAALPFWLGVLTIITGRKDDNTAVPRFTLLMTAFLALLAVFFPKDFYLPFLKSATLFAHFFFLFGVAGKGCFLLGAIWAIAGFSTNGGRLFSVPPDYFYLQKSMFWTVWGFAFWTFSMFSGELWSYTGWGTPVIWDDPAITTTMATWFFYICLLHLHLTGSWSARTRAVYFASGVLVVPLLTCLPDLGPFRWPL